MFKRLSRILIVTAMAIAMAVSAWAITLEEAAEQVAREYNAKVISARTIERDGRRIHVIRILTEDDVVRTVRVPADRR